MCNINKEKFRQIVAKRRDNTQILREINFGDSRTEKSAIIPHLEVEALNFDFHEFLHFLKAANYQNP